MSLFRYVDPSFYHSFEPLILKSHTVIAHNWLSAVTFLQCRSECRLQISFKKCSKSKKYCKSCCITTLHWKPNYVANEVYITSNNSATVLHRLYYKSSLYSDIELQLNIKW